MANKGSGRRVYLDHQASTPCDPRVVEAMLPFLTGECANPASAHWAGDEAERGIFRAREQIATLIGCLPHEIFFTAGATESNNLAILGSGSMARQGRVKIVTTPIEHKSVLEPIQHLVNNGFKLEYCPVRRDGMADLGCLAGIVDEETLIVSVQLASNEVGTIQQILEVAQIAHRVGALVHTDAAQVFGKIPIDVEIQDVDLLSFSGHKIYGPKGVGGLFVRGGVKSNLIGPILFGGGQEFGVRPGTLNVPGIVGLGEASRIALERMEGDESRTRALRDLFEQTILNALPGSWMNGAAGRRMSGATSLTIRGVQAEALLANIPDVAISTGSACNSGAPEPSHVLTAIGLDREDAYATIRASVGRFTSEDDVVYAADRVVATALRLRAMAD